ncbi:MAG: carbon monoxide dehydrogenase [Rhizobiales bacterium]|nr:carbon monoxide dehydrogenase [Hyphomicrobiales bacterium]
MKPVAFDYERPQDIAGALALAGRADVAVKFLAGGQSLGPMLNLRLAQPDLLVDLTGIAELKQVGETTDALEIGACITHADIEDGRVPDVTNGALAAVAHGIAYRAVRNRGTIGGSLAHADPAADWVTFLAAIGAGVVIRGSGGRRVVPVEEFMTGVFETVLAPNDLVTAIRIPRFSADARWGYYKACRKTGEFAYASAAVLHDPTRSVNRAVIGAVEARPIVLADAGELFGRRTGADIAASFVPQVAMRAMDTAGFKNPIEQKVHAVALRRAVEQACAR